MRATLCVIISCVFLSVLIGGCQAVAEAQAVQHYERGRVFYERGDYDAALAELAKAIQVDPDFAMAHTAAGDIHRRQGDLAQAESFYVAACDADPYAFRPHYNLGVTCQMLAEAARAVERFDHYLRAAAGVYLRAVTLCPSDFDTNLNLSACYFQLGKYQLAEQYCRAAIGIDGDSPEAFSNLGIILDSQNRLYEAIAAYKESLELDIHQPNLLLNLGSTYLRQGALKAALSSFKTAAAEAPDQTAPWEQMGVCCYHMGDLAAAESAYRRALEINPQSATSHRGIGIVYMTRFMNDKANHELRDKALAAWGRSLEIDPQQSDLDRLVAKYTPKPRVPQL